METTLIFTGVACVIAAIIGGGVKLLQVELRVFDSLQRQILLGVFGAGLIGAGLIAGGRIHLPSTSGKTVASPAENASPTPVATEPGPATTPTPQQTDVAEERATPEPVEQPASDDTKLVASNDETGLPPRAARAGWDIGLAACAIDSAQANALQRYIVDDLGFAGAREVVDLESRANWIAPSNTVFHYREESKATAEALSRALSERFAYRFRVSKGAGLGLKPGMADQTLFVHVMSDSC